MNLNNDEINEKLNKIEIDYKNKIQKMTNENLTKSTLAASLLVSRNNKIKLLAEEKFNDEVDLDVQDLYREGMNIKNENPSISKTDLSIKIFERISNSNNKTLSKLAKEILKEGRL